MIPQAIGTIGVLMVVAAYFFLITERLTESDWAYVGLNVSGSICILVSLYFHFNLAATLLQAGWIAFSLAGLLRRLGRG